MKKKLLFWCPFLSDVGTINATLQSMESLLDSKKFNCKIMNVYGEFDEYSSLFKKKNIEEIKLLKNRFVKKLPKKGFIWSRLNYILIFILSLFPLFVYLKKNKEEIMFIYLLSSLPLFVISFFNLSNKIIFRISGKVHYSYLRRKIWLFAKNKILKILIQTNSAKKRLIKEKIFNRNRILFLEDPIINIDKINYLKNHKIEKKYTKKKFYVAIGRLTKQKNFLFLVRAIAKILEDQNLNLLILGEGEQKFKIQQLINEYGLNKKIFLTGYKKNIYKYLNRSEGLICTSLWEEPGFVIQEAAACKKIILTSDCESGPSEFLENGLNGFVFLSDNIKSFQYNFNKMIIKKKLHEKMIKRNFTKINKYSKIHFKNQIEKFTFF